MSQFVLTLTLALIVIALCLLGLSIGWLLAGKPLQHRCGYTPGQKKDKSCGKNQQCPLCSTDVPSIKNENSQQKGTYNE